MHESTQRTFGIAIPFAVEGPWYRPVLTGTDQYHVVTYQYRIGRTGRSNVRTDPSVVCRHPNPSVRTSNSVGPSRTERVQRWSNSDRIAFQLGRSLIRPMLQLGRTTRSDWSGPVAI